MKFKFYALAFVVGFWLPAHFVGGLMADREDPIQTKLYWRAKVFNLVTQGGWLGEKLHLSYLGRPVKVNAVLAGFPPAWRNKRDEAFVNLVTLGCMSGGLAVYILWFLAGGRPMRKEEKRVRGTMVSDAKPVAKALAKVDFHARIGGVPYPKIAEVQGVTMVGAPGTGKTSAIIQLMQSARDRGQRAIVLDPNGEFLERFWRDGDAILNPFDARSESWSPFSEIMSSWDAERFSKQLIPDGAGSEKEWLSYTQTFFLGVMGRLLETGKTSNSDLVHWLSIASKDELKELLKGEPAAQMLEEGAHGIFGSVRSILTRYTHALQKLDASAGADSFSVRKWVKDGDGWLFLTYQGDQLEALKDLLACWLSVAGNQILSMPPDRDRRIWLFADEFPRIGRIQGITEILTNGRKHGLAPVLGMQTVAQLRDLYGKEQASVILACLSSILILRAPDAETADTMSRTIGEQDVERKTVSENNKDRRKSTSVSRTTVRAVLPSQIAGLPNNHGYLRLPGNVSIARVQIPHPPAIAGVRPQPFVSAEKERIESEFSLFGGAEK